jgi:phage baseplate assembly protein W
MPFINLHENVSENSIIIDNNIKNDFNTNINDMRIAEDISLDITTFGVVSDLDCISQSISNIILTNKKERLFNLDFGTNLLSYIFENQINVAEVARDVAYSINKYEKRVHVNFNDVTFSVDQDEYYVEFTIPYTIIKTKETAIWQERLYV